VTAPRFYARPGEHRHLLDVEPALASWDKAGSPGRVVYAGGAVEGLLRSGEGSAAGAGVVAGGVAVCFHDQALGEQGR
jgi:hypothetical protein